MWLAIQVQNGLDICVDAIVRNLSYEVSKSFKTVGCAEKQKIFEIVTMEQLLALQHEVLDILEML